MLDCEIVAIGPGWAGKWPNAEYGKAPEIRCFAEGAHAGDLVVAKQGRHRALAIGVLGEYDFNEDLDDIEGWDLCHFRPVRWLARQEQEHRFESRVFIVGRFSRCVQKDVVAWVERVIDGMVLDPPDPTKLASLPAVSAPLDVGGLDVGLQKVIERAKWWQKNGWSGVLGGRPSESELLTHVTVQLLRALGWPAEQIAIGWRYRDIVLFSQVERTDQNCRVIIEGKRLGDGLRWAKGQAERYASKLEYPVEIVVTDGIRYELVRPEMDERVYANLANPRESAVRLFDALRYRQA
jgi:hypothetical protein